MKIPTLFRTIPIGIGMLIYLSLPVMQARADVNDGRFWVHSPYSITQTQLPNGSGEFVFVSYLGNVGEVYAASPIEGSSTTVLLDGRTSWNDVARDAAAMWNPYLKDLQITVVDGTPGQSGVLGNGISEIYWYDGFDITKLIQRVVNYNTNQTLERDIVIFREFATAQPPFVASGVPQGWNSYRNQQVRYESVRLVSDLRRQIGLELGFLLGLEGTPAQIIPQAQWTSTVYSFMDYQYADRPNPDDIIGLWARYGAVNVPLPSIAPEMLPPLNTQTPQPRDPVFRLPNDVNQLVRQLNRAASARSQKKTRQLMKVAIRLARGSEDFRMVKRIARIRNERKLKRVVARIVKRIERRERTRWEME